jgi:hypothetical protein
MKPALLVLALAAFSAAEAQTGLVPLNDLGSGTHGGFPGGLYPGSVNHPPAEHHPMESLAHYTRSNFQES